VDRIRQSSLHSKIIFEVCLNGIGGTLEAPTFDKTRNCLYLDRQKTDLHWWRTGALQRLGLSPAEPPYGGAERRTASKVKSQPRKGRNLMAKKMREWSASERKLAQTSAKAWQDFFAKSGAERAAHQSELEAVGRVVEVRQLHEAELLTLDGVVGVAESYKVKAGKPTKEWAIIVLVEEKHRKAEVGKNDLVPAEIDDIPTDVVEVGKIEALVFNAKTRPALPGFSIGHYAITAGTFGCVVRDIRHSDPHPGDDDYLILSNNHVLANINAGKPGDLILQPGPFDGGLFPSDTIATLDRFEPIILSQFASPTGYNLVDAALARPSHSRNMTASIIGAIMPQGVDQARVGTIVIKAGRTTQVTVGTVIAVNATVVVGYGSAGNGLFRHQILTTAMAAGGDSGSLLMDRNLKAVGLLFAGSSRITIHNHIADVEAALGVRPVCAPTMT
jgi:hypothetical protein